MLILGLFCLLAVSCTANVLPEAKEIRLSRATNDFAFQLFNASSNEKNVFISPFSVSTALAMLYTGAAGTTAEAMRRVLKYEQYGLTQNDVQEGYHSLLTRLKQNNNDYHFATYNGALIDQHFNVLETYENAVKHDFEAEVDRVDFATQGEAIKSKINADVENATRGKIRDFLDEPPSPETKLFLLNAVYFLGSWRNPFKAYATHESTFYSDGTDETTVQMMNRDSSYRFSRNQALDASFLIIPYRGNNSASMIIVLPNERTGVVELQHRITREALETAISNSHYGRVMISVPKFRLSYGSELKQKLATMGLEILFDNGADLSGLGSPSLKVNKVVHKAVIDVDEKGTEAAASTRIEAVPLSRPPRIRVDHPFLFFIRDDENGVILFAGRVDRF